MSACYVVAGLLAGIVFCRTNAAEPGWGFLIIPAFFAFCGGIALQDGKADV